MAVSPAKERWRRVRRFLRANLTPRAATALALWRVEARLSTPLALAAVAAWGRWPGAFAMAALGALLSAAFIILLERENVVAELRAWTERQGFFRRFVLPIADRRDRTGTAMRVASVPAMILFLGPFWRGLTLELFRIRGLRAYLVSVLGSIPHALLWVGLVLGGIWDGFLKDFLRDDVWPFATDVLWGFVTGPF
jgi:hypothetical protein